MAEPATRAGRLAGVGSPGWGRVAAAPDPPVTRPDTRSLERGVRLVPGLVQIELRNGAVILLWWLPAPIRGPGGFQGSAWGSGRLSARPLTAASPSNRPAERLGPPVGRCSGNPLGLLVHASSGVLVVQAACGSGSAGCSGRYSPRCTAQPRRAAKSVQYVTNARRCAA